MKASAQKGCRIALLLAAALAMAMLPAAGSAAEPLAEIEINGSSTIYGDNVSRARELAIEDGLAAALERVAAEELPIESLIQNFKTLDDILFSRQDAFVQDFKVMTENRGAETYRVIVRATISRKLVRQTLSDAGIMVGERPMPRVVLFLTEQKIGESVPEACPAENAAGRMPTAAAAMAKNLRSRGFTVLDPEALGRNLQNRSLACRPDFDNNQAARIGAELQADIVIVGTSVAAYAANTMGSQIRSFSGKVSARAIRTDTAETIAATEKNAVVTGADPEAGSRAALAEAGGQAAAALAPEVLTTWKTEKAAEPITLKVVGTQNLGHFVMFRRALAGIEGVSELQTREMRADQATLAVEYDGTARDLAETLLRIPFEAFGINITEEGAQTLQVELISG
jgi:hypothetical protein